MRRIRRRRRAARRRANVHTRLLYRWQPCWAKTARRRRSTPSSPKTTMRKMVTDVLAKSGVVLVCWQHEDIPLEAEGGKAGISQEILTQTGTKRQFPIPKTWPTDSYGQARYDLIFVFTRNTTNGKNILDTPKY